MSTTFGSWEPVKHRSMKIKIIKKVKGDNRLVKDAIAIVNRKDGERLIASGHAVNTDEQSPDEATEKQLKETESSQEENQ